MPTLMRLFACEPKAVRALIVAARAVVEVLRKERRVGEFMGEGLDVQGRSQYGCSNWILRNDSGGSQTTGYDWSR